MLRVQEGYVWKGMAAKIVIGADRHNNTLHRWTTPSRGDAGTSTKEDKVVQPTGKRPDFAYGNQSSSPPFFVNLGADIQPSTPGYY